LIKFFILNSLLISLNIVIKAILVLPDPVGAAINKFSSELKALLKTVD
jgi:hypothetical protein